LHPTTTITIMNILSLASLFIFILAVTVLTVAAFFIYRFGNKNPRPQNPNLHRSSDNKAETEPASPQQQPTNTKPQTTNNKPLFVGYKRKITAKVFKNRQLMFKKSRVLSRIDAKK
jgi:flagellar basal body-associated protein FliL